MSRRLNLLGRLSSSNCRCWLIGAFLLSSTLVVLARSGFAADATEPLDPRQPYQVEKVKPVTYDVDFSVVVTPPYHAKVLKVWLPMPQADSCQEVTEGSLGSFPLDVKPQINVEPVFGNKFAYFEFEHPDGAQLIRHTFKVKVWELHWHLDPSKVERVAMWPEAFAPYLQGDKSLVLDDRLLKTVHEIVPAPGNPALDIEQVMTWVNATMKYDHNHASLQASSSHALDEMSGHCSDYHGLCAAFGRALNYPTRVTYGINPEPKNSPSHCKMEAFLPPYGWVSFDVSETQQMIERIKKDEKLSSAEKDRLTKAANERLFNGFRDNTWYLQTRGTGYQLVPPAVAPVNVVRTAYIEADGQPLPDPDPANTTKREFAWMTVHKYTPDVQVKNPFKDVHSLEPAAPLGHPE